MNHFITTGGILELIPSMSRAINNGLCGEVPLEEEEEETRGEVKIPEWKSVLAASREP